MTFAAFDFKKEIQPGEPFYDKLQRLPMTGTPRGLHVGWHQPTDTGTLSIDLFVERLPAVFYTAVVALPSGAQKTFSTGSGSRVGALLSALCAAFESGLAGFGDLREPGESCLRSIPAQTDGRDVRVFVARNEPSEPALVVVDEAWTEMGHKPAQSFWVQDHQLAQDLAQEIADGMLDVSLKAPSVKLKSQAMH